MEAMLKQYRDLFSLEGKNALVTGGGGGIGRAVCEGLASLGAKVHVLGRSVQKVEAVAGAITAAGGRAEAVALDVLDSSRFGQYAENLGRSEGNINIFINCVGIQIDAPAEEYTEESWDRIMHVNLKSAFFMSQAVARVQLKAGGGRQVHITSVRSLLGINRGFAAYCTSKGGMSIMVKQLATEWARYRINVNAIAPTFIRTEQVAPYLEDPSFYEPLVKRIPLGRVGEPVDVAGLAMYLASPAADFVTGQNIFIDGGVTATQ